MSEQPPNYGWPGDLGRDQYQPPARAGHGADQAGPPDYQPGRSARPPWEAPAADQPSWGAPAEPPFQSSAPTEQSPWGAAPAKQPSWGAAPAGQGVPGAAPSGTPGARAAGPAGAAGPGGAAATPPPGTGPSGTAGWNVPGAAAGANATRTKSTVPGGTAGSRTQLPIAESKGFVSALFDFSFSSLVTPKVIKGLYLLIVIVVGLSALAFAISMLAASLLFGLLVLVVGVPLYCLVTIALYRVLLEFFMVIFRMAEDIRALRERGDLR
jgi:Domain of unknown function (DUF4282)